MAKARIFPHTKAPEELHDFLHNKELHPLVTHYTQPFSLEAVLRHGAISEDAANAKGLPYRPEHDETRTTSAFLSTHAIGSSQGYLRNWLFQ